VRIVLQVAVHGDDVAAARMREAGGKRGGLTEIAAEPDHPEAVIGCLEPGQNIERVVGTAVIDDEDFEWALEVSQRGGEFAVELLHVRGLVAHRYDDRDVWLHRFARR
jgi:hypothetical protein